MEERSHKQTRSEGDLQTPDGPIARGTLVRIGFPGTPHMRVMLVDAARGGGKGVAGLEMRELGTDTPAFFSHEEVAALKGSGEWRPHPDQDAARAAAATCRGLSSFRVGRCAAHHAYVTACIAAAHGEPVRGRFMQVVVDRVARRRNEPPPRTSQVHDMIRRWRTLGSHLGIACYALSDRRCDKALAALARPGTATRRRAA